MSRATKRKHVLKEIVDDDYSAPKENQQIVRIIANRGNNLHDVQAADETKFLVSMPTKFRRNIWVKRGDYVLVEPIKEGNKVKAEIVRILTNDHIKYFKQDNVWPKEFESGNTNGCVLNGRGDETFENTNRLGSSDFNDSISDDPSSSSDDDEDLS